MYDFIMGKHVRCVMTGAKTYDRFVGTCYLNDKDVGIFVIEVGLALNCPRFSAGGIKMLR